MQSGNCDWKHLKSSDWFVFIKEEDEKKKRHGVMLSQSEKYRSNSRRTRHFERSADQQVSMMEELSFNVDHGYLEGLVRGMKAGILTQSDYHNLAQCDSLEGENRAASPWRPRVHSLKAPSGHEASSRRGRRRQSELPGASLLKVGQSGQGTRGKGLVVRAL